MIKLVSPIIRWSFPSGPGTCSVFTSYFRVLINSTSFHSQNCPALNNKLYGHSCDNMPSNVMQSRLYKITYIVFLPNKNKNKRQQKKPFNPYLIGRNNQKNHNYGTLYKTTALNSKTVKEKNGCANCIMGRWKSSLVS